MPMLIALALVVVAAFFAALAGKALPFVLCPLCVGVSMTWLALTALVLLGILPAAPYIPVISLLMGGTVVGVIYQGEKNLSFTPSLWRWRIPVAVVGFLAAYVFVSRMSWQTFAAEALAVCVLLYVLFVGPRRQGGEPSSAISETRRRELEEKMEKCC